MAETSVTVGCAAPDMLVHPERRRRNDQQARASVSLVAAGEIKLGFYRR
jgi:hypothetical protein